MDPNARAAIDADGFGGYTALFSTVVSQRNFWVNYGKGEPDEARFTRLLLNRAADPNVRASSGHASRRDTVADRFASNGTSRRSAGASVSTRGSSSVGSRFG